MKKLLMVGVFLVIAGCMTNKAPTQTPMGRNAEQLNAAADTHQEHTETILDNATKIYKESKEPKSVERAGTIIDSTTRIKELEQLLREEALVKTQYEEELTQLREHAANLQQQIDSGNAKKYVWLRMFAALVFAGGIVGFFILKDPMLLGISAGGIALAASTFLFNFIEDHITVIGFVTLGILVFFAVRVFLTSKRGMDDAVEFGEIAKQRLRDLNDVDFLKDLTGDRLIKGKLGQSPTSQRMIKASRKKFKKVSEPLSPRVYGGAITPAE